ncbi:hypothetical protein ABPG72_014714 [Tetrahymena utriculariae]
MHSHSQTQQEKIVNQSKHLKNLLKPSINQINKQDQALLHGNLGQPINESKRININIFCSLKMTSNFHTKPFPRNNFYYCLNSNKQTTNNITFILLLIRSIIKYNYKISAQINTIS